MKKILFIMFLTLLVCLPLPAQASTMKVKGKLTSQTSLRISWKGSKDLKYWRIRRAVINKNGNHSKFKTIKTCKKSKRSYTVKNLKKNRNYVFEIIGGKKVKGKFKALKYDYIWSCYTGMSMVSWDDYAETDYDFSPTCIQLAGYCENNGLPIKGFELYRREKGGTFRKIKTLGKKSFPYMDKTVKAGKTYEYKFRSYGTYKKKKKYSPYSSILTMSAVNKIGTYYSEIINSQPDRVEFKMKSTLYNASLTFKRGNLCIAYGEPPKYNGEEDYPPLTDIFQMSKDGTNWKTMQNNDKVTIRGGETVYFAIKSATSEGDGTDDVSKIYKLEAAGASYNNIPCFFNFSVDGKGSIYYDAEAIH